MRIKTTNPYKQVSILILMIIGIIMPFIPTAYAAGTVAVQAKNGAPNCNSGSTYNLAFTSSVTLGNFIVVTATGTASSGASLSVTDSLSNSFSTIAQESTAAFAVVGAYAKITNAGSDTITITQAGATPTVCSLNIYEVSGLGNTVGVSGATGVCPSACSSPAATGTNVALTSTYFAASMGIANGAAFTISSATSQFTILGSSNNGEYSTVSATSPTTFSVSYSGSPSAWYYVGITLNGTPKSTTTTAVSCSASSVATGTASKCTATISGYSTDISGELVSFGATGLGAFSNTDCVISGASCYVYYTPSSNANSPQTISAIYSGDDNNDASQGTASLTVTNGQAVASLAVSCSPSTVSIGVKTDCTATLSSYAGSVSGEAIIWGSSGTGTFANAQSVEASSCPLASAACSLYFTPTTDVGTPFTISASYSGDTNNFAAQGTASLTVSAVATTSLAVACTPHPATLNYQSICTATLSGYAQSINGEIITWGVSGNGGEFAQSQCALTSSGTCFVGFTPKTATSVAQNITASYTGDQYNSAAQGTYSLAVDQSVSPVVTVSCSPNPVAIDTQSTCSATLAGYVNAVIGEVVSWSSSGAGSFSASQCALSGSETCSVIWTPSSAADSPHVITAVFAGDQYNPASQGTFKLQVVSTTAGGFTEGFDGYGISAPSIPPWNVAYNSNSCWTGAPNSGVTYLGNGAQSTPNSYQFAGIGSCYGSSNNATLSVDTTASEKLISVNFYIKLVSGNMSANKVSFNVYVNSQRYYTVDASTLPVGSWTAVTSQIEVPATPGNTYNIQFETLTSSAVGAYAFVIELDTITFNGVNPINVGYNTQLVNYPTNQWFPVSGYPTSYLIANYTSKITCSSLSGPIYAVGFGPLNVGSPPSTLSEQGNSCIMSNIQSPDLIIPQMGLANLITFGLGTSYTTTLIPCIDPLNGVTIKTNPLSTCNAMKIQLEDPSLVAPYVITISDQSGTFDTAGTKIFVYLGTTLITSGYVDSQSQFPAALLKGVSYKAVLITSSGNAETATTFTTSADNAAVVLLLESLPTNTSNNITDVQVGAGWSCNLSQLTAQYVDTTGLTTSVTFNLIMTNSTYPKGLVLQTATDTGSFGTAIWPFTNVNSSLNSEYSVTMIPTRTDEAGQVVTYPIQGISTFSDIGGNGCGTVPSIFPAGIPNFPTTALGLNAIFKNPYSWVEILSLVMLCMMAALFGARSAGLGGIFVAFMAGFLMWGGWLQISPFWAGMWIAAAIISFVLQRRKAG